MNDFWFVVDEEILLMLIWMCVFLVKVFNLGGCIFIVRVVKELVKRCQYFCSLVFYGVEVESEMGYEGICDFLMGLEFMDLCYLWGNFKFMR